MRHVRRSEQYLLLVINAPFGLCHRQGQGGQEFVTDLVRGPNRGCA